MIKAAVIALTAVAPLALGADCAVAQGQAWCLFGGDSGAGSCGYYTFEQCLASRAGGSSFCAPNPNYPGNRPDTNRPTRSGPRR